MRRILWWSFAAVVLLAVAGAAAFRLSPWPAALLIRHAFDREAERVSLALEKHLPPGVSGQFDLAYDAADADARLDVFYPPAALSGGRAAPTIVWTHGGGWVSGSKAHVANYARILAGRGYTVAAVDYSIAPGKTYPVPVRQLNAALGYLAGNARALHLDPTRMVLAGDSAGAHISAQVANLVANPAYAQALGIVPAVERRHIAGLLLYCGPYDTRNVNLDGAFGGFLKTVLWSYSGTRSFMTDPAFATASVIDRVTGDFPPAFISAGNGDPLQGQSLAFADALVAKGVAVERLFFPKDYAPALPHEYQFNLDTEAGRLALERSAAFLARILLRAPEPATTLPPRR
jgi:acetyl esterase/lipase